MSDTLNETLSIEQDAFLAVFDAWVWPLAIAWQRILDTKAE